MAVECGFLRVAILKAFRAFNDMKKAYRLHSNYHPLKFCPSHLVSALLDYAPVAPTSYTAKSAHKSCSEYL
jgi:hypothetical protein